MASLELQVKSSLQDPFMSTLRTKTQMETWMILQSSRYQLPWENTKVPDQVLENISNWSLQQRGKVTTKAKTYGDICTFPLTGSQQGKEWIWAKRAGGLHMSWRNPSDTLPKTWGLTEPRILASQPATCLHVPVLASFSQSLQMWDSVLDYFPLCWECSSHALDPDIISSKPCLVLEQVNLAGSGAQE